MRINLALCFRSSVKIAAVAGVLTLFSADLLQNAVANGDTRTLTLQHVHSGKSATVTFKRSGRYDPAALRELDVLMQDWRHKETTKMDPQLYDILWEVYREVDATQPIQIIGGYRSPATNAMLRSRSRGVAKTSLHMKGKAVDFFIPGVPLSKLRVAGLRLQRGGVGFYPTSGSPFVHMDTGGVRHWPRMTRTELARVFPTGKTVHVPSDGKPMSGYATALASIESRGDEPGGAGAAFAGLEPGNDPKKPKNIFAALFGKDDDEAEADAPAASASASSAKPESRPEPAAAEPAIAEPAPVQVATAAAASIPLPVPAPERRAEPAAAQSVQLASAAAVPLPLPRPAQVMAAALPPERPPAVATASVDPALAALAAAVPMPDDPAKLSLADPVSPIAGIPAPLPPNPPSGGLPEVIVGGTDAGGGSALAYASASAGLFPAPRTQPGRAPGAAPAASAKSKARAEAHTAEMRAEIRRLFSEPTVANNVMLRTPELRRFAAFVAPPRQVVATGFGTDGTNGLSTQRFEGAAVVAIPVVAVMSGPAPVHKPL